MLITPKIALGTVVLVIILAFAVTVMVSGENYESSRVYVFVSVLGGLSILVTFLFYYSVVQLQQLQEQLFYLEQTSKMNIDVSKELYHQLISNIAIVPDFVKEVLPLQQFNYYSSFNTDSFETDQQTMAKFVLASNIFDYWQNVIFTGTYFKESPDAYICEFLQYASSPQLYSFWLKMRINYGPSTRNFGNLLFQYSKLLKNKTADEFERVSKRLYKDYPTYILFDN